MTTRAGQYRDIAAARAFLRSADAALLVKLLEYSRYRIIVQKGGYFGDEDEVYVELESPPAFSKAIETLPEQERDRLIRAIAEHDSHVPPDAGAGRLLLRDRKDVQVAPRSALFAELLCQRDMLIDVATGGARFNDVNDYYKSRRHRIGTLGAPFDITDPSPFSDLWAWYKHWTDNNWSTYAERRDYINSLYDPVLKGLLDADPLPVPEREPTGWERVDRAISKARAALESARAEEDFQSVGLLCREALISLGQAVFDAERHPALDGVTPSETDAKRMLEAFIAATVPGESNETIRRHAKASLSLAIELQHRRTASFRQAALCLEATSSTLNVVAILAGRRDPAGLSS